MCTSIYYQGGVTAAAVAATLGIFDRIVRSLAPLARGNRRCGFGRDRCSIFQFPPIHTLFVKGFSDAFLLNQTALYCSFTRCDWYKAHDWHLIKVIRLIQP